MKIRMYTMRQARNVSLFLGGALIAVSVSLSSAPAQVLIGLLALLVVARFLSLPSQIWVRVDAGAIAWKTPRGGVKNGLSPSGSVRVEDIVSAVVAKEQANVRVFGARKQVEMRGVRLGLRSGESVMLPLRVVATNASATSPLRVLVDELKRQHSELASSLAVPTM
ncbi:hypothetical protein ACFWBX_06200 [Streptomyces sp. NPDC059991]|uniref:hypothetical protein n=1 Tax=Streptomyces sp. NPDC059991 TaxID=3347028 RepID=UPI0036B13AE3